MGSAVIFSGTDVKTLKSNIDIAGAAKILTGTADPTSSAQNAPAGSLYLNTSTGTIYRKLDSGSSTNWDSIPASSVSAYTSPELFYNVGLTASVSSNALTIALKTASGADPSGGSPVKIAFRSSTATSGVYNERSVTGALSVVVSSGSTLGHVSGQVQYVWVYAIDNAGTVELAVAGQRLWDRSSLVTTTAEGGAGAADSAVTIYSTTARTGVPAVLLGRLKVNEATAGTWATTPSEVSVLNAPLAQPRSLLVLTNGNGHGSTNTSVRRWTTTDIDTGTANGNWTYTDSASAGGSVTINKDMLAVVSISDGKSGGGERFGVTINSASLTTTITSITYANGWRCEGYSVGAGEVKNVTIPLFLKAGDIVREQTEAGANDTSTKSQLRILKVSE